MIEELYKLYLRSHSVTTDSRRITPGCLFFAFKGENFDGNAFAAQALEQGAAACIVSDTRYRVDGRCFVTEDVLSVLQALAQTHREHLTIPVIGITGTNGKTTTKELIKAVLSKRYRTSATAGNYNNHIGVPLTLLGIPEDCEIAIVEMGANHPGEIADLCEIAQPDSGLITNVGRAHLEGFGSFDGVVNTKTALYRHLAGVRGTFFVSADNERLMQEAVRLTCIHEAPTLIPALSPALPTIKERQGLAMVSYGSSEEAQVKGALIDNKPYMRFYFEVGDNVYNVSSHLIGAYNFDNAMAAVAVGLYYGVEPFDIKEAIEEYVPSNQRSEWRHTDRNDLYLDCYNANPSSMAAAIASFKAIDARHKMAIIGGMHELGSEEEAEHKRLIEQLDGCGLERCLLIGREFDGLDLPHPMQHFQDTDEVRTYLHDNPVSGATILVKGSNTNRLWTLTDEL